MRILVLTAIAAYLLYWGVFVGAYIFGEVLNDIIPHDNELLFFSLFLIFFVVSIGFVLDYISKRFSSLIVIPILLLPLVCSSIRQSILLEPQSQETSAALAVANQAIPLIHAYRQEHGRYPCYLEEALKNSKAKISLDAFKSVGWYRPTTNSFHIFIKNEGGIDRLWYPGWGACTALGSCPPGEFSPSCCGKKGFPTCDGYNKNQQYRLRNEN